MSRKPMSARASRGGAIIGPHRSGGCGDPTTGCRKALTATTAPYEALGETQGLSVRQRATESPTPGASDPVFGLPRLGLAEFEGHR